jgi:hypothetical protein
MAIVVAQFANSHVGLVEQRVQVAHLTAVDMTVGLGTLLGARDLALSLAQHAGFMAGELAACDAALDAMFLSGLPGIDLRDVDVREWLGRGGQRCEDGASGDNGFDEGGHEGSCGSVEAKTAHARFNGPRAIDVDPAYVSLVQRSVNPRPGESRVDSMKATDVRFRVRRLAALTSSP